MRTIEVWADVSCPFAHVGLRRWARRRAEVGAGDVHLRVRAWPLGLVNGEPLTGAFVAPEVADLRAQVAPDLFAGFDPTSFPATTLPALRLTARAYEVGLDVGERVALALRDCVFERGQDVADPDVLADVARQHGSAPTRGRGPRIPWRWTFGAGQARGVIGSPHFFGPGIDVFCPTLQIRREGDRLHIETAEQRFADLCAASFG